MPWPGFPSVAYVLGPGGVLSSQWLGCVFLLGSGLGASSTNHVKHSVLLVSGLVTKQGSQFTGMTRSQETPLTLHKMVDFQAGWGRMQGTGIGEAGVSTEVFAAQEILWKRQSFRLQDWMSSSI